MSARECGACRGRRHVYDREALAWRPCDCAAAERAEAAGPTRPLTDFGRNYPRFVRRAITVAVPSLVVGRMPALEEAGRSAVAATIARADGHAQFTTVRDLVDLSFDREGGRAREEALARLDLLVVLAGPEPAHKYNADVLGRVLVARRVAGRGSIVAWAGPGAITERYGEPVRAAFRGGTKPITHRLPE